MPINDKINRTFVRNRSLKNKDITNTQKHNERENEIYQNPDIVKEHSKYNINFKSPNGSYQQVFEEMEQSGAISTRGLKSDAVHFGELIFNVNSAYFHNNGGYEFAKQFYQDAYKAATKIIGGEEYIISAVMHADERNRAISEALGQNVFHYHLHVVYIPIVEKEILWSKRCKDKSLIGTVKETVMQVSHSKKWTPKEVLDEEGKPVLSATGKKTFRKSYSVLQDDFYNFMKKAGYDDIERGERGSTEEHLTVTQFKVKQEQERLSSLKEETEKKYLESENLNKQIKKIQNQKINVNKIEEIKTMPVPLSSKVIIEKAEYKNLSTAAKKYAISENNEHKLQNLLNAANKLIAELKKKIFELTAELNEYKSVRKQLNSLSLEQENKELKDKLKRYETIIKMNNIRNLFNTKHDIEKEI